MTTPQQQLVMQVALKFPDGIFYKETAEKVVALTIDDVPTPNDQEDQSTVCVLNAIAAHNQTIEGEGDRVRATFFIITSHLGQNSTIIEQILSQGHEIANHGIADDTTALQHPEIFALQLRESHKRIVEHCPHPIRWYRPGRGLYVKKMVASLQQMPSYEPRFALASMIPLDTFKPTDQVQFTAWYVSQFIFPGAILVLHGGTAGQCRQTAGALKLILKELSRRGYRVLTLSELWDLPS